MKNLHAIYTVEQLQRVPWRVGRHLGRTLYAMVGDQASEHDILLGMLDEGVIAAAVVAEHNGVAAVSTRELR